MSEMPGSWERMIKEAIGAEEQMALEVPGGFEGVDWGKGIRNLAQAWLEDKAPWTRKDKPWENYGTIEELLEAERKGEIEIPLTESMLMRTGVKELAKGAKGFLAMAKGATDPNVLTYARESVRNAIREGRKVPQSAWDTVREVGWEAKLGKAHGDYSNAFTPRGVGDRELGRVRFNPYNTGKTTPMHEIGGHGRQWAPGDAMVPYRGGAIPEEDAAEYLRDITMTLRTGKTRAEYQEGLYRSDPLETHAEALARKMLTEGTERYEELYPKIMGRAIEVFEKDFPKEAARAYFKFMSKKGVGTGG